MRLTHLGPLAVALAAGCAGTARAPTALRLDRVVL